MKRPPHIVITLAVAAVAFGGILLVKRLMEPSPPEAWLTDEVAGFARARKEHKAVLIDMTASWSMPSVETSRALDELRPLIDKDFVAVRIDISDGEDTIRTRYGVGGIPAVVFVDADGRLIHRITQRLDDAEVRGAVQAAALLRAH